MAVFTGLTTLTASADDCPPNGNGGGDGGAGAFVSTVWAKDCPPEEPVGEKPAEKEKPDKLPAGPPGHAPTSTMILSLPPGACFPSDGELIINVLGRGEVKRIPVTAGTCAIGSLEVDVPFWENWVQVVFFAADGTIIQLHMTGEGPCPEGTCGSIAAGQEKAFELTFP